jgi:hypothetical protein
VSRGELLAHLHVAGVRLVEQVVVFLQQVQRIAKLAHQAIHVVRVSLDLLYELLRALVEVSKDVFDD